MSDKKPSTAVDPAAQIGERASGLLTDSTLAPAPLRELLAAEGASICMLSVDGELVDTVQESAGEQYPISAVASWPELLAVVEAHSCGIVLLDIELLETGLERRIEELKRIVPGLVVLVASPRKQAESLMNLLSERKIHRLLMKPAAVGITRLLIESAVSRYLELRGQVAERTVPVAPPATGQRRGAIVAALILLVAVGAGAAWWLRTPAPPPAVTVSSPQTPDARAAEARARADEALIAGLLERAGAAEADGRLDAPAGDNALDHYLSILRIDPGNATAAARMESVLGALFSRAEAALLADAPGEARDILDRVRRVSPDNPRLAFLDAQVAATVARQAPAAEPAPTAAPPAAAAGAGTAPASAPTARAPEAAAPPSELDSLLALVQARLRRGELLTPQGDSARAYLDRATVLDAEDSRVQTLSRELAAALVASARAVLDTGQLDRAEALRSEAARFGADPTALADLARDVGEARDALQQQQEGDFAARVDARMQAGQLIEPATDSALYYLLELQALSPASPGLGPRIRALTDELLARGRAAVAAVRWQDADRWLGGLRQLDPGAAATLERELTVAQRQADFLGTPVPAGELELVEAVPAEYPEVAVRNNIEGWVEVQFVVGRDGRPTGLEVVAAEPPGRFDQAALDAVSAYRYAPFELDGTVYERLARLRIRFALQ